MDQSQKLVDKVNELFFTAKSLWIDKDFKGDVKVQLGEADIKYYSYFLDSIKKLYQRIKGEIKEKYVKVFKEKNKDLIDLYELKGGDISEIIEIPIPDFSVRFKIGDKKYINYDPISEKIIELPIINFDSNLNKYSLNYSNTKKIKRKKITFK